MMPKILLRRKPDVALQLVRPPPGQLQDLLLDIQRGGDVEPLAPQFIASRTDSANAAHEERRTTADS